MSYFLIILPGEADRCVTGFVSKAGRSIESVYSVSWGLWALKSCIRSEIWAVHIRIIRCIPICFEDLRSTGLIWSGVRILRIFDWNMDLCIWQRFLTGIHARCCPGNCRILLMPISACVCPCYGSWALWEARDIQYWSRSTVYEWGIHWQTPSQYNSYKHGWKRKGFRQCSGWTFLEKFKIWGGVY